MSEQDGTQPATKPRRSRQTSKQNGIQTTMIQRPANDDTDAWKAYWKAQGQEWRTEPETDVERQKYLAERRSIKPDDKQGVYPFKDIKLSRVDVEWLLATHENGRGPIDWSDESQRKRKGLDLRGADLRHEDLHGLPLTKLRGSLASGEWLHATEEQRAMATVQMEGINLSRARLEGADLFNARLEGARLDMAQLAGAGLMSAQLEEAGLSRAQLEGANLVGARLEGANLSYAQLEGAALIGAQLAGANLSEAELAGVYLEDVGLANAHHIGPRLADVQWGDTNLTVVDWEQITMLGDEHVAAQKVDSDGKKKEEDERLADYKTAVRAYRQLSVVLRNQGLNEDAARFAYRAQLMQRVVFRLQRKIGQYLFSGFLDLLAGYGYKLWRSFVAYLLVIIAFATAYFVIGHTVGPVLSLLGSFVFSMTSFHGRGFFPGGISLDDPLTVLAALEAFVGLLIEVTFIATLTQRLFGK